MIKLYVADYISMFNEIAHKNKLRITILLIFFIFVFINFCQPLIMDDFWRSNINALHDGTIFPNLYHDYFYWTGRISAQTPIYIFFNKSYPFLLIPLNLINAFAMTTLLLCLYNSAVKFKHNIYSKNFIIYLSLFILFSFKSGFIASGMWKTTGIQYLWGLSLLIYIYQNLFIQNKEQKTISILSGVILGCYNEAFLLVIFTIIFYYIIFTVITRNKLNSNTLYFFIPFIIAGIFMVCAPGNYLRTNGMIDGEPLFSYLISHFADFIVYFVTKPELSLAFLFSITLTLIYEKNTKVKIFTCLGLISISLTMFLIMFGLSTRVEMIYMVVYFYIFCKYFLNIELINRLRYLYLIFVALLAFYTYKLLSAYYDAGLNNRI